MDVGADLDTDVSSLRISGFLYLSPLGFPLDLFETYAIRSDSIWLCALVHAQNLSRWEAVGCCSCCMCRTASKVHLVLMISHVQWS